MPVLSNLSCVTSLIGFADACGENAVTYRFEDNGISLAKAAKTADERYITGQNLADQKVRIALDDVYAHLTRNVVDVSDGTVTCDLDKADGIICAYADRVARAVWYRATALMYKEQALDSSRYNEFIQFAGDDALAQMVYYSSEFKGLTNLEQVQSGRYEKEIERLEPIKRYIEQTCCTECVGGRWSITLP